MKNLILLLITAVIAAACSPAPVEPDRVVYLIADGRNRTYALDEPLTVGEFLRLPDINVELDEDDDVNPELFTQISDQMRITVVRVSYEEECRDEEIPYEKRTIRDERIPAGETREGERGQVGIQQVCYRTQLRDNVRQEPVPVGNPIVKVEPQDEIIYVAPDTILDPVPIRGTIAYFSNGNAWVMRDSSTTRRPLTDLNDLDSRVFALSPDGTRLLLARKTAAGELFGNQLWLIPDVNADPPTLIQLRPDNVLFAVWRPGVENTITYSRAEPRPAQPFYTAYNDFIETLIDPETGESININPLVEEAQGGGGPSGWYGRQYQWSADGTQLAYIQANEVGRVDLETSDLIPMLQYESFTSFGNDYFWRTTASWSPDNTMLAATIHGDPISGESPERSPVFHIGVSSLDGTLNADLVELVGIWSFPQFSPFTNLGDDVLYPKGHLAYMQAREPVQSFSNTADYDLIVADRDGSNARVIFPEEGQGGILSRQFVWSPDGTQIATIYQGNIWLIDVEGSAPPRQLTSDGNATKLVWTL